MSRLLLLTDDRCAEHDTGRSHPECVERLSWIRGEMDARDLSAQVQWKSPVPAAAEEIDRVHTSAYRRFVEEACLRGKRTVDFGETLVCEDSFDVGLLAAGGAIGAVDAVLGGEADFAFSLCRPPGHHARPAAAMGFCLFNNVAIAAAHARASYEIERVFILDWDVHHGNGTQEMFYEDPGVFFVSLHESPLYPHTGHAEERGRGRGTGFNLNIPLAAGAGREPFLSAFEEKVLPAMREFKPELILLSAGFDAHHLDPLAHLMLDSADYGELTRRVLGVRRELGGVPIASVLEGGYHPRGLAESVCEHVQAMLED